MRTCKNLNLINKKVSFYKKYYLAFEAIFVQIIICFFQTVYVLSITLKVVNKKHTLQHIY